MELQGICMRLFAEDEDDPHGETRELVYVSLVLFFVMFATRRSDRLGPGSVMMMALTLCMAAGTFTIKGGLERFSNEGVLPVMVSNARGVALS